MSAELPKTSNGYVSNRLEQLERRLEQAKKARDDYIEFLKQNQVLTTNSHQEQNSLKIGQSIPNQRPSLMRRLETGQHFWDFQNQPESYSLTPLPTTNPVPRLFTFNNSPSFFRGMVLNSDVNSMTKRLREISSSIRNLRDYRLSMPSDEYFKSVHPHLQNAPNHSSYYGDPNKADLPSLAEIRSRILSMQFNVEKRTRELIDQKGHLMSTSHPNLNNVIGRHFDQSNPTKKPEWLHQKELLEEELKKMSQSNIEAEKSQMESISAPKLEPQRVINSAPSQIKEPNLRAEDNPIVISSNRQILFGDLKPVEKKEVDLPVKSVDSKEQYNRMLGILRPKQVEISSSDEEGASGVLSPNVQVATGQQTQSKTLNTPTILTNKNEASPISKTLPSFLQTPTSNIFSTSTTNQQKLAQSLVKSSNLSDSDSDFFK